MRGFILAALSYGKHFWIEVSACLFGILIACCMVGCANQSGSLGIKERIEKRNLVEFQTTPSIQLDPNLQWMSPGNAKELINILEKMVVVAGGSNPIPDEEWDSFKPRLPWVKNLDRHLLFTKTVLLGSPDPDPGQQFRERELKGYTWLELAQPIAFTHIPDKTNMLKPEPGHVVIKTIRKRHVIVFKDFFYQLTDNQGNFYAMHATETGEPNLNVELPEGWTLKKADLAEPLVVLPVGKPGECFFNILGDHAGQGYHQYVFADEVFTAKK